MENKFQTSFIPKKSFSDTGSVHVKTPRNLIYIIGIIVIVITMLGVAGMFGYSYYLDKQISIANEKVVAKEKAFNYKAVQEVVSVDNQLRATNELLKNHSAPSAIFTLLEKETVKNLRFSAFQFDHLSPSKVAVIMKGEARTFGAVAKQMEYFTTSSTTKNYFVNPIFSDLSLDEKGMVRFSFVTVVDPSLITYKGK